MPREATTAVVAICPRLMVARSTAEGRPSRTACRMMAPSGRRPSRRWTRNRSPWRVPMRSRAMPAVVRAAAEAMAAPAAPSPAPGIVICAPKSTAGRVG